MTDVPNPNPKKHWSVRRRTMYVSILLMVVFSVAFIYIGLTNIEALKAMGVLIGWIFGTLSIPIIGYYSNTAVEQMSRSPNSPRSR